MTMETSVIMGDKYCPMPSQQGAIRKATYISEVSKISLPMVFLKADHSFSVVHHKVKTCNLLEPEAAESVSPLRGQLERSWGRRHTLAGMLLCSLAMLLTENPEKLLAEEVEKEKVEKDENVLGGLLSIFDPNETTKLGKKLPKAYLKSARDVVQTLRDSFSGDVSNDAKFRRTADSAREAIREYISNWRGAKIAGAEESDEALDKALHVLGEFYSKKGPRAVLPEDVRNRVLEDLKIADDAL